MGATVVLLDGSSVRSGLSRELDYSPTDRAEHLRRVAHLNKILNDQGIITICSFISPDEDIRNQIAEIIGKNRFHLIYMDANLEYCKKNKPGLYEKSEKGKLKYLPGIDLNYEIPQSPVLSLKPENSDNNTEKIIRYLSEKKVFPVS